MNTIIWVRDKGIREREGRREFGQGQGQGQSKAGVGTIHGFRNINSV